MTKDNKDFWICLGKNNNTTKLEKKAPIGAILHDDDYIFVATTEASASDAVIKKSCLIPSADDGFTGSFTNGDGNTVTVENCIITDVS